MSYHFLCPLPEVEFTKEKTTATCSLIYGDSIKNSGHLNGNEQTDLKFACHHPWAFSNPTVRPHLHPFNQSRRKGPSSVPVAMIFFTNTNTFGPRYVSRFISSDTTCDHADIPASHSILPRHLSETVKVPTFFAVTLILVWLESVVRFLLP
jgi:hypothetical protein